VSADKDLQSLVDEVAKQVLRVTQLSSEVSRYKAALESILKLNGGHRSETNHLWNDAQAIARNALKDGP
jgi:hypothetical protein